MTTVKITQPLLVTLILQDMIMKLSRQAVPLGVAMSI
jgi:hypothetical protein